MEKSELERLREIITKLRGPNGCPWDMEQTHLSLRECLIEEVAELLDTIDREDMPHMREELGDVLLHIMFHASIAEDKGLFNIEDVACDISDKLVRRHPHVFGDVKLEDIDAVWKQWDDIKAIENKDKNRKVSIFKHLPPAIPALLYARDVYKQMKKKNLDFGDFLDTQESIALSEDQVGKALFQIVAQAKAQDIDPESALRQYVSKLVAQTESQLD